MSLAVGKLMKLGWIDGGDNVKLAYKDERVFQVPRLQTELFGHDG